MIQRISGMGECRAVYYSCITVLAMSWMEVEGLMP